LHIFTKASIAYGLFLIFSGVYRFFIAGSKNALWFGIVMGAFALLAGFLSIKKQSKLPYFIQLVVIIFVGGFFTKKILGDIEGDSFLRVISLIIFSVIMAILTGLAFRNKNRD
jgi:hypothetical protein